jgi:beta-1,4-mannosyl-glycoprotein beta-1,4-N-acetylglucosaminyltransferase
VIYDTFMLGDELDILECRLRELESFPDLKHVIIEADVAHRGFSKPLWFAEHRERFSEWDDRIIHVMVKADELPTDENPWSRELAQREFSKRGLGNSLWGDVVLHGDCDEIPRVDALQKVLEGGVYPVVLAQRLCQYAVDWVHPQTWQGTIVTRARSVGSFAELRGMRNSLSRVDDGGSHLSWMGGTETHVRKLGTHCHLEMTKATEDALRSGEWLREGMHSDGSKLIAVDVDGTWPQWVWKRECPASWFRPRDGE